MSEAAKNARDAMRAKAKRLTSTDPHEKVDSSTWTPPEPEDAGVKTGARPLVKRLYKKGGKVVGKAEGNKSAHRADRKPRKAGGKVEHKAPWIDDFINRDVRMANDEREGIKHVGGFKTGGKAHKASGGKLGKYINQAMENYGKSPDDPKNKQRMTDGVQMAASKISGGSGAKVPATRKSGGRAHKLSGGSLVNYINSAAADMGKTGAKQPFDFNRASKRSEGVDLAARKLANQNVNVPASGMKKGGKVHKFGGGMIGNNPIADQNIALGKAAGMKPATTMKKGGRSHRADGGTDLSYLPIEKKPAPKPFKPTGIEQDYNPNVSVNRNYTGPDYSEGDAQIREMLLRNPRQSSDYPMARKHGGKADGHKVKWIQGAIKHPGSLHKALHVPAGEKIPEKKLKKAEHSENPKLAKKAHLAETLKHMHHAKGGKAEHKHINKADELADKDLIKSMVKHSALQHKKHGGEAHPHDCACHKCSGGRMGKYSGGGIFSGDSEKKIPGVVPGGRSAHAKGGKAKGKTNVNIIIGTGHGQQQPPMGMMPNAPVPAPLPQRLPPAPGGMPPGGMPPMGPQGAPPMPPQGMPPMGRKSGGRAYPIDSGSGGGEARLEKIDAYGLKPAKMK